MAEALAEFDRVWEALSPIEKVRLAQLLIARVDYDGRDGTLAITFHPTGIKNLRAGTVNDAEHGEATAETAA